jgi:hypothetical protein
MRSSGTPMNTRHIAVRAAIAFVLITTATLVPLGRAAAIEYAAAGYAYADFDNNGFGDLAIASPGEAIGSVRDAGAVHIFYGTQAGFRTSVSQLVHQGTANVEGVPQSGDHFGQSLAPGDFDGDGFDDLAIGIPGEKLGGTPDTGLVYVMNGSQVGLTTAGARSLRQGTVGIGGSSESGDRFGWSLATGNFNADAVNGRSVDDLVIGVPGEDFNGRTDAGVAHVLYGSAGAGVFGRDETISENSSGMEGDANSGDRFGWSLATGNWNGDTAIDLAIGAPFEGVHDRSEEGVVFSLLSTAGEGVKTTRSQIMSQDTIFTNAEGHSNEHFGFSLAAGDFDSNSPRRRFDDLAIGVPGDLPTNSGAVNIVYGTEHSFELIGEKWFQGKAGPEGGALPGSKESDDLFGAVLAAADVDGNGAADLAIGVPGEDIDSARDVGGVHLLLSSGTGLDPRVGPNSFVTQDTRAIPGDNESGDQIGAAIASTDFDNNGKTDLVIGCPGENIGSSVDAGAAIVIPPGLRPLLIGQNSSGVEGRAESNDRFGEAAG